MTGEVRALNLPIDEVTVFEDRARVTRRGVVELGAGQHRIRIFEVSPVLSDQSISVSCSAGATVIDARVQRRKVLLDEHQSAALAELAPRRQQLELDLMSLTAERSRLEETNQKLDEVRRTALGDWSEDVAWGRAFEPEAEQSLQRISARRLELAARHAEVELEIEETTHKLRDIKDRFEATRSPRTELRAELVLDVDVQNPEAVEVAVEYVVPCACWRPEYRAELIEEPEPRIVFSSLACVWQNTGEPWDDVRLRLSTERPSLGTEPPVLHTDRLRAQRRGPVMMVEARDQRVDELGLGQEERVAPSSAPKGLPGIDDGGEALELCANRRVNVPSDGRPHRAELSKFESRTELEHICFPELAEAVFLKSTLTNLDSRPVLAGPVQLLRNSGLAGRTRVAFVAPKERFELGWGPLSEVSVVREKEHLKADGPVLGSWTADTMQVRIRLCNLSTEPLRVQLWERIPVSELEKIEIEVDPKRTSPRAAPNREGLIRWGVETKPSGHSDVKLTYIVRHHSDVAGLDIASL